MNPRKMNLRTMMPSASRTHPVSATMQLKGDASKDSLTGKNVVTEHVVKSPPTAHGGKPTMAG